MTTALDNLWKVLEKEEKIDLYEAIEKAGLEEKTAIEFIKEEIGAFMWKWTFVGTRSFTKKGFQKEIKKLADNDLFYHIMLLHRCKDTKPKNPGGGLPVFFDKLETIHVLKPSHPCYKDLVLARANIPESVG
jgi:hypothetical protein